MSRAERIEKELEEMRKDNKLQKYDGKEDNKRTLLKKLKDLFYGDNSQNQENQEKPTPVDLDYRTRLDTEAKANKMVNDLGYAAIPLLIEGMNQSDIHLAHTAYYASWYGEFRRLEKENPQKFHEEIKPILDHCVNVIKNAQINSDLCYSKHVSFAINTLDEFGDKSMIPLLQEIGIKVQNNIDLIYERGHERGNQGHLISMGEGYINTKNLEGYLRNEGDRDRIKDAIGHLQKR